MSLSELLEIVKISKSKVYKYLGHNELALNIVKKLVEYKKTRTNHYILPDELLAISNKIPLYGIAKSIIDKELTKMKAWYEDRQHYSAKDIDERYERKMDLYEGTNLPPNENVGGKVEFFA